jgi:hypothetical protein
MTGLAGSFLRDADRHLRALDGLLERQPHLGLEVSPSRPLGPAPAPEDVGEDVAEGAEAAAPARRTKRRWVEAEAAAPEHPSGVVLLALLRIGQRRVSLLHLLEALLCLLVARIAVGMKLPCEFPVRLLDLVLRGVLGNSEDVVVVARHHRSCDPSAGLAADG